MPRWLRQPPADAAARVVCGQGGAGLQSLAQHIGDEGDRGQGEDRRQVHCLRQAAQMAVGQEGRQRQ